MTGSTAINDWLFSPGILMEAGRYYNVSYWRRVQVSTRPDSIEVKAGFVPAASQMSITVAPTDTCRRQVYVEKVGGFVCPVSGVYYIG